jgi:hypothetical protein
MHIKIFSSISSQKKCIFYSCGDSRSEDPAISIGNGTRLPSKFLAFGVIIAHETRLLAFHKAQHIRELDA